MRIQTGVELDHRVKTHPNGRAERIPTGRCPVCRQMVDLKGSHLKFRAHRNEALQALCPTGGMKPLEAHQWRQRQLVEVLGEEQAEKVLTADREMSRS